MTYELALNYLASLNESRIKPGLERINEALKILGFPHSGFPHVLVGGTNGKGSVVCFIGSALQCAGYRTGLFTSPHLVRFEERIVVEGGILPAADLPELVMAVKDTGVTLTYFEFCTAMALHCFASRGVDIALLEVGLGGAWDATNATDPCLSVITNVGLDHQAWLGNTPQEIACEKSGIMRYEKPVVAGPVEGAARRVIMEQAAGTGSELVLHGRDFHGTPDSRIPGALLYEGLNWRISGLTPGPKGHFQLENAACALAALECLDREGWPVSEKDAVRGVESARWPGRYQEFGGDPEFILDAAHNPAALKALISSLGGRSGVVWVFSALSDKDVTGMAAEMSGLSGRFVLVPLSHPRALSLDALEKRMPQGAHITKAPSLADGLRSAEELAGENGCVVVAGSVVLAGEVLEELGVMNAENRIRNPGCRGLG